jgi:anti-anti-sigma regulatory factor
MDAHALTMKTVRDGPLCTLILRGDLDLLETGGFLEQAALAVDDRTERLVFDLAGVAFLDCAGVRALSIAARAWRLAAARSSSARSVPGRAGSLSYWTWTTFGN